MLMSARKSAGMSTTELAFRLGVSEASVKFWESGHVRPHVLRLEPIAKLLKIDKETISVAYANDNGEAA